MPLNNLSVGSDISFVVVTSAGTLTIDGKTSYKPKHLSSDLEHHGLYETTYGKVYKGWQVGVMFDRSSPAVENYFIQDEANYYAGVNQIGGTIYETVTEKDGTTSQYRYTNVILKYDEAGDWKKDGYVGLSVTAMASRKIRIV